MGLQVGELSALLSLDSRQFETGLMGAGRGMGSLTAAAGAAAIGIGAALAGGAAYSLLKFGDFEQGMNEIFTLLPGISQQAMDSMSQDVQDFSREFGVLPDQVIPALYQSLSAGIPQGNVFDFLETAQKLARAGVTDLETAVDGLTSTVNAYGQETLSAADASDVMVTAVRLGKTTIGELSDALFQVNPIAASAGVEFGDVAAAMATLTSQGVPTSVAATQIRQALVELSDSGTAVSQTFADLTGQTFRDFIAGGGDLGGALQTLQDYADDTGVSISDLFGSVEAGQAVLALTGDNADTFAANVAEMGDAAGATEEAYGRMASGVNYWIERLKAWFAVAVIDIGEKVAEIGEGLADFASRVDEAFNISGTLSEFRDRVGEVWDAIRARAAEALPDIRDELAEFAKFLKRDVGSAIVLIGDQFENAWKRIKQAIEDIDWEGIKRDLSDIRDQVNLLAEQFGGWGTIVGAVGMVIVTALAMVSGALAGVIWLVGALINLFGSLAKMSLAALQGQINGVKTAVSTAVDWVKRLWAGMQYLNGIILSGAANAIKSLLSPLFAVLDAARSLQSTLSSLKVPSLSIGPIKIGGGELTALGAGVGNMMAVAGAGAGGAVGGIGTAAATTIVDQSTFVVVDSQQAATDLVARTARDSTAKAAFLEGRI